MEERLFWIGVAMGLYAWGTRYGSNKGLLDTRSRTTAWHGAFCAIAGFAATLVAVMSIESRSRFTSVAVGVLSPRELYPSLAGALVLGAWGALSAHGKGDTAEGRKYFQTEDMEWAETVFSAVLLASVMMYLIVQAFKIPSGSMRNTLLEGDHIFVNKFIYGVRIPFTRKRVLRFTHPERGDVIVFQFPTQDPQELHCGSIQYGKDFIKRVIGLPGETVQVTNGEVLIDGKSLGLEPYAHYEDGERQKGPASRPPQEQYQHDWETHQLDRQLNDTGIRDDFGPVRVPDNAYFAMGDNRDRSCDSRYWGPVEDYYLKGKAWVLYWPLGRMGKVH